jgi:hypothetical protein
MLSARRRAARGSDGGLHVDERQTRSRHLRSGRLVALAPQGPVRDDPRAALFGDHASYILVLVAPLYWLWPDPRLLLLLQLSAWPAFQWIDMTGLRAGRYRLRGSPVSA